ncbi:hypothetical protein GEMRC1_002229 [Eukaryota sp. GEM-RC1]
MPTQAKQLVVLENDHISQIVSSLLSSIQEYPLNNESLHIVMDQLKATLFRELISLHVTCPASDVESIVSETFGDSHQADDSMSSFSESLANGLATAEERLKELEEQRSHLEEQLAMLTSLVERPEDQQSDATHTESESEIRSNIIIDTEKYLNSIDSDNSSRHAASDTNCYSDENTDKPGDNTVCNSEWWQKFSAAGNIEGSDIEVEPTTTPKVSRDLISDDELTDTVKRIIPKQEIDQGEALAQLSLDDFDEGLKSQSTDPLLNESDVGNIAAIKDFLNMDNCDEILAQMDKLNDEQTEEIRDMIERFRDAESELSECEGFESENELEEAKSHAAQEIIINSLKQMNPEIQKTLIQSFKNHLAQYQTEEEL